MTDIAFNRRTFLLDDIQRYRREFGEPLQVRMSQKYFDNLIPELASVDLSFNDFNEFVRDCKTLFDRDRFAFFGFPVKKDDGLVNGFIVGPRDYRSYQDVRSNLFSNPYFIREDI